MKINRQGTTRTVLIFSKFVIKIPDIFGIFGKSGWFFFIKGIIQNEQERKTWNLAKNTDLYNNRHDALCPVKWASWGGWILIMERARILSKDEWEDIYRHYGPNPFRKWEENGFTQDNKPANFGWFDNRLVKLDYGQ